MRSGKVMAGRYHVRWLKSPRQVWNALQYTLLNVRKHYKQRTGTAPPVRLDDASSGRWFDGWKYRPPGGAANAPRETALARTWLLRAGWKRYGTIDPAAVPAFAANKQPTNGSPSLQSRLLDPRGAPRRESFQ